MEWTNIVTASRITKFIKINISNDYYSLVFLTFEFKLYIFFNLLPIMEIHKNIIETFYDNNKDNNIITLLSMNYTDLVTNRVQSNG